MLALETGMSAGHLTTSPFMVRGGFHQALPTWNISQPSGTKARILFRAAELRNRWTPWFSVDKEGQSPDPACSWEVDQMLSASLLHSFQLRIELERESAAIESPKVRRICVAARRRSEAENLRSLNPPETVPSMSLPFLHQHELSSALGARICSPVSVAMILRGRGADVAPLELAVSTYHGGHDLYGVWPLAIHAAYQLGMGGWVEYFEDWCKPVFYLKRGTPLVLSIAFEEGDLKRPPYKRTGGHLLVLLGVDEKGHPITHDPNLPEERGAYLKWETEDLARAWFGHGGVAYVFPSRKHACG